MSATVDAGSLPRWDMSNVYSGLAGDDYRHAMEALSAELSALEALFDARRIRRLSHAPAEPDDVWADDACEVLERVSAMQRLYETLESFVYAFFSTDSYDALASREMSRLELLDTRRQALHVRLKAWIGSVGPVWTELIKRRDYLREHEFFLRHTAKEARFMMDEALEALAAELCVDGALAFGKLQGNATSQLKVSVERGGRVEELPITMVRNLCFDPDPAVRERAYRAEVAGWHTLRTTVAASLNAVKGTAVTLARRRGRASVLDASLDANRIDRPTLDALLGSIREYFPVFRRYLKSKAKKLGRAQLPWWDLFAPVGSSDKRMSWEEARHFIVEKFGSFSRDLGDYAAMAFDRNWIDAGPRDGKRGGAFCMPVIGVDESRVLMNYDGSFDQVSTLAHELGHGYHNHTQRGLPPLRRGSPATLAETASIFCETLIAEAAMADASPAEQLTLLETQLAGATQVCVDISSRFLFESAVVERRSGAELSPDELCEAMKQAQAETYADAVDPDTYHPYMWLWKPHYYSHQENFYNFPYAFGHLFGLGLYAVYLRDKASFPARYVDLLRSTGQSYAAPLAARFGIDITRSDFWRSSLALIADQVERYERL